MAGRGRPRKYTPERLKKAVERYFLSISRRVEVTERVDTGLRDGMGHVIYRQEPVENALGERVYQVEYFFPPSMRGLYEALGIDKSTWAVYADHEKHPELARITDGVYERMKAWNENELLTRAGKDLKGIIFNLEKNYGYDRTGAAEGEGIEGYLKRLEAEEGEVWL